MLRFLPSGLSGELECIDSSIVTRRGGGLGSRNSIGRIEFELELLRARSSNGVFEKRAHHVFERRIFWSTGGFASMMEDGRLTPAGELGS